MLGQHGRPSLGHGRRLEAGAEARGRRIAGRARDAPKWRSEAPAGADTRPGGARPQGPRDEEADERSTRPKFAVGHVVAEAAEPHSALEVVAVEDGLYTLRYKTDNAWRGHEIARFADELVPFGASLPKLSLIHI